MSYAVLYKANETDFNTLGLGVLRDAISPLVTEERNGQFELSMSYPVDGALFDEIKNDRIIKADAGQKLKAQRFKIIRITKPAGGIVKVYAEHVSYLSQDLALKPSVSYNGNATQALTTWKNNIVDDHPFTIFSDIQTTGSGGWAIDKVENARRALGGVAGSILDTYGGEYRFDNYHIGLYANRGNDSGALIAYGKNLTDIEQKEEIANTYTSIYPYTNIRDEEGNESLLTLPEYFVDSEYTSNYARRKIKTINFQQDDITTVEQLRERAEQYIVDNDIGVPSVNLTVKFVDLSKTLDYKDLALVEEINLCDQVTVYYEKLGIRQKAKVIKTVWNVALDRYEELVIGKARANLSQSIGTTVDGKLETVVTDLNSVRISADGKTKIFTGIGEPIATNINDLWYKPVGDGEVEMYIWNGVIWSLQAFSGISEATKKVEGAVQVADGAKEDALQAILDAKAAFNKAVDANGIATTVRDDLEAIELIPGPKGDAGVSTYVHLAYANSADGATDFSIVDSNRLYIGMYIDTLELDSTSPSKYKWSLIKGADGAQGIQGIAGVDGRTPYLHIAYATNATGTTGFSTTDAVGKTYIGQYTDYTSADSTNPALYKWTLIKGDTGAQGLQGLQGADGAQGIAGVSSYTHIAYSTSPTGSTGFSTSNSVGATYVGMYVDSNPTDSETPSAYNWTLIKGADGSQGIQGPTGANGQTSYLHIAYATNSTGTTGFSTTDSLAKTYIGQYTDFVSADSTNPALYSWTLIKGADGADGEGVVSITQYYYKSNSPTGLVGGSWTTAQPSWTNGTYIWSKTVVVYTDKPQYESTPVCISGKDGNENYTWIKYAPTKDTNISDMVDTPSATTKFIGMAYNKKTATESNVKSDYVWTSALEDVQSEIYDLRIIANSANLAASGKNTVYRGGTKPSTGRIGDIWFQQTAGGFTTYVHDGTDYIKSALDGSAIGGVINFGNVTAQNFDANSITTGNLQIDRGLKIKNGANTVMETVGGNVQMTVDNLLIGGKTPDQIAIEKSNSQFFLNAENAGLVSYDSSGEPVSIFKTSTDGTAYIAGKNIVLDGDTVIDGSLTVTDTIFADTMDITKFKTGTFNAANINVINMDANAITTGSLRADIVQAGFDGIAQGVSMTADGLKAVTANGEYSIVENGGVSFYASDGSKTGSIESGYNAADVSNGVSIFLQPGKFFTVGRKQPNGKYDRFIHVPENEDVIELDRILNMMHREIRYVNNILMQGTSTSPGGRIFDVEGILALGGYNRTDLGWFNGTGIMPVLQLLYQELRVFGTLNMNGNVITNQSDIRLKDKVVDAVVDPFSVIEKMRFINFEWDATNPYNEKKPTGEQFGMEAQYAPFLAVKDQGSNYLSIDMGKQVNINSMSLQRMISEIKTLKEENTETKKELADLKQLLIDRGVI